jgi:hypothetical protein
VPHRSRPERPLTGGAWGRAPAVDASP